MALTEMITDTFVYSPTGSKKNPKLTTWANAFDCMGRLSWKRSSVVIVVAMVPRSAVFKLLKPVASAASKLRSTVSQARSPTQAFERCWP
eukprot:2931425-Amphidinium_carterae.1